MNDVLVLDQSPKNVRPEEAISENSIDEIRVYSRSALPELEAEIEAARRILDLGDDWDGGGSPKYSESTFERAATFLRMHNERFFELFGVRAAVPQINPGPNGSIDIHWKRPSWELLVNIPAEEGMAAAFYGDDYGSEIIRGSLDASQPNRGLIAWLMK